jgi:CrcB protein
MDKYLLVGIGAFLGACARFWLADWAAQKWGAGFPYGTLIVNVTGSFVLGLFLAATTERVLVDPRWRLFIAIGIMGGYTTFSTYTYESVQLLLAGNWGAGLGNLLGNNLLGLTAAVLGVALGRQI